MTAPGSQLDISPAVDAVTRAEHELLLWSGRQTDPNPGGRTYVAAGHAAVTSIDAALTVLHRVREALAGEIHQDNIERAIRVDHLLAQIRQDHSSRVPAQPTSVDYERSHEMPPGGPLPPGIGGWPAGGRGAAERITIECPACGKPFSTTVRGRGTHCPACGQTVYVRIDGTVRSEGAQP